ncbi:hypothetical protein [Hymenobacter ruricola]|uniref:Uncharacterized protein n=1 Tax=Hymenobacter ruricola TaxID=2791023 RepID=A0ABS0IAQ2_9BACT|nr:hypothetical protein [Hymenobacter ruricola]MBF9224015.1 hypothetical protein [Hymenobacter ruricola]
MQNLLRLLSVVFADTERSIEDTSAGFLEHNTLFQALPDRAALLKANQTRTAAYAAQLTGFNTAIGSSQAGQQVGRTLSVAEQGKALARLKSNLAALNNDFVVADAALRATLVQLLYPRGLEEYSKASFKTLPDKLRVYLDLVQDPTNQVPAALADKSVEELAPFATAREKQAAQQQATGQARQKRRDMLPLLEEQLTRNLHALCVYFEDNRSQVASFYNNRYFGEQAAAHPGRYAGQVGRAHTSQVVNLAEAPARYTRLSLAVDEDFGLSFYRTDDVKAPTPADALRVTNATPRTLPLAEVPGKGALLVVRNDSPYLGHYTAELLAG